MLEYQNLFTRVQIRTAPDPGLPMPNVRLPLLTRAHAALEPGCCQCATSIQS